MPLPLTHADVLEIIRLLDNSTFDELHLEIGDMKLSLRRGDATPPATPSKAVAQPADTAPLPQEETVAAARHSDSVVEIKSPLLGTFYRAPRPGESPFVMPGDTVGADSTIGIIEVMKLMNPVPARVAGRIVEVLVQDGDMVEYGQPLMLVEPDSV